MAVEAVRELSIEAQFVRLDVAIKRGADALDKLESRLGQVIRREPGTETMLSKKDSQGPRCELAERLAGAARIAEGTADKLASLLDILEV